MSDEINIKTKSKKTKLFIIIAAIVIVFFTVGAVIFAMSKSATAKKVEKQLSLGEKYLSELDYEQAIVAYELAIEIDPKNAESYIGLADVYIAMGDYEKAEEILEEAKDKVTNEADLKKIKRELKRLKEKRETEEGDVEPTVMPTLEPTVTPTPEPTATPTPSPMPTAMPTPTATPMPKRGQTPESASVGDYITFGTYEQDNNPDNGAEPIEWLVLDKKDGKVLVLSEYALDTKRYHEEDEYITWENCTLRSWLNNEFYYTAFSSDERADIVETLIQNDDNAEYGVDGGNDTRDKVFLLSIEEAISFLGSEAIKNDPARRATVTEYAKAQGGWTFSGNTGELYGKGEWWLRSPGWRGYSAAEVTHGGSVESFGEWVLSELNVVRPALWIICSEQETKPTPVPENTTLEKEDYAEIEQMILAYIKGETTTLSDPRLASVTRLEIYGDNCCMINNEITMRWTANHEYGDDGSLKTFTVTARNPEIMCNAFAIDIPEDLSSYLPNVTALSLYANRTGDLSGWTNLTELDVYGCEVSDMNDLKSLSMLKNLFMQSAGVSDISALANLKSLESLQLDFNGEIEDISALENLTNLYSLGLSYNKIKDISALSNLKGLVSLSLTNNQISDLTPLYGLKSLFYCYVYNNNYSEAEGRALKQALPKCGNLGV